MRKSQSFLFGLCMFCFFLAACQPTPADDIVVNKGDGAFEQMLYQETNLPWGPFTEEELTWKQEYDLKQLNISVDVVIAVSDSTVYPIYKVQKSSFSDTDTRKILDWFIPNPIGIREGYISREQRAKDIEYLYELEKNATPLSDEEAHLHNEEWRKEQWADWAKMPEDKPFEPITVPPYSLMGAYTLQNGAGEDVAMLRDEIGLLVSFGHNLPGFFMEGFLLEWQTISDSGITAEQAIEKAEAFIHAIGLDYLKLAECRPAQSSSADAKSGYYLMFGRGHGGIPIEYTLYGESFSLRAAPKTEYIAPWHWENVHIFVCKDGVRSFYWNYPHKITETVTERAALMSLDTMRTVAVNFLRMGFADQKSSVRINWVKLSNCIIPVKDDPESCYIAPVWVIAYTPEEEMITVPELLIFDAITGAQVHYMDWGD